MVCLVCCEHEPTLAEARPDRLLNMGRPDEHLVVAELNRKQNLYPWRSLGPHLNGHVAGQSGHQPALLETILV